MQKLGAVDEHELIEALREALLASLRKTAEKRNRRRAEKGVASQATILPAISPPYGVPQPMVSQGTSQER